MIHEKDSSEIETAEIKLEIMNVMPFQQDLWEKLFLSWHTICNFEFETDFIDPLWHNYR